MDFNLASAEKSIPKAAVIIKDNPHFNGKISYGRGLYVIEGKHICLTVCDENGYRADYEYFNDKWVLIAN